MLRAHRVIHARSGFLVLAAASAAVAQPTAASEARLRLFAVQSVQNGLTILHVDAVALEAVRQSSGKIVIEQVPVAPARTVDLRVERFHVTTPLTRFVVGMAQAP